MHPHLTHQPQLTIGRRAPVRVMRCVLCLTLTPAALACRARGATATAFLIVVGGGFLAALARNSGSVTSTVALTMVAIAAGDGNHTTARARSVFYAC